MTDKKHAVDSAPERRPDTAAEVDDLYEVDIEFDASEDIETENELGSEQKSERRQRGWLYAGLFALLLAVLLRLLLSPVLDIQEQRLDSGSEISKQVQLTNQSAEQALTVTGSYSPVRANLEDLSASIDKLVLPNTLPGRFANRVFANSSSNAALAASWLTYREVVDGFIANQAEVDLVKDKVREVFSEISTASNDAILFVTAVAKEGRSKGNNNAKDRYLFLTSEAANINGILNRLTAVMLELFQPSADIEALSDTQNTLLIRLKDTLARITSNAAAVVATAAEPLRARIDSMETKLLELGDSSHAVTDSRDSLQKMRELSADLTATTEVPATQADLLTIFTLLNNLLPLLLLTVGIFSLWRFFKLQSRDLVQSEGTMSDALAEQQESILKLLDEMSALADGDLTVEAEVTNQITGAIADSVNFAVIEMRELVSQINRASVEVANESKLAVSNAQSVSHSNIQQADQITAAALDMQQVTNSMREMSDQAHNSSQMATESIQVATQGAQAVRDTIKGMEDMREQIQDTSKRIKRLGESSQRIGDIVALIDDIAEQTNILSLNAAIQASMAGEAGRGFAVVADEVQGLAERSTVATKKIAELVTTIQNDTNDAVSSMEKATQQVINGTKVADTAGGALAEIETVSQRLSTLIEGISQSASSQAQAVIDVAQKVTMVSDSSTDTSRKAQDSANSIAKLLELAKELETSVSRFKLPVS